MFAKVLAEAWENKSFKTELVANPEQAIKRLTGKSINLKKGNKIVVTDQSEKNTFYFNIPAKPNLEDIELTEEQLEMVAGGGDFANGMYVAGRIIEESFHLATFGFFR